MTDDISRIIAGVNPNRYYSYGGLKPNLEKFKKSLIEDFQKATSEKSLDEEKCLSAEKHKLIYDSLSEQLEPTYYSVLDLMSTLAGKNIEKIVDNFAASPGSGHFGEIQGRNSIMQKQGMEIMRTINMMIRDILNLLYELKELEMRLGVYDDANSKEKAKAEAGLLSLKQIWMDNVDIKKGIGSINNMSTGNLNFVTLRDAFMAISDPSLKDPVTDEEIDLNERVKRILKARIEEFLKWRELSEKELKKRFDIEKTYLRTQSAALKLYSRWARPYLIAANDLEQFEDRRNPALVKVFNTIALQLTLLAKDEVKMDDGQGPEKYPKGLVKMTKRRKYYKIVLIDFKFRGVPNRISGRGDYSFGGKTEVVFRAYSLNEEELALMEKELEKSDISTAFKLVQNMTDESISKLQEDIDYYLSDKYKPEKKEEKEEGNNPFLALLGFYNKDKKDKKKDEKKKIESFKDIEPDNYGESILRDIAETKARESTFKIFDIYKKSHGMPSHPHEDYQADLGMTKANVPW